MTSHFFKFVASLIAFSCLTILPGQAQNRHALIIGNGQYGFAPLKNPVNDAEDMAAVLQQAGFSVTLATDIGQSGFNSAVSNFANSLQKGDVALFFFAGHGVQFGGRNYLIPTDANLASQEDVKQQAFDMSVAMDAVSGSGADASIFIIDACRDNPLPAATRSLTRGLARASSSVTGMFVSFSTSPGAVALDGEGRNSPYTKNLIKAISTPNLSLEETFKQTLKAVHEETDGAQTPWISSSFFGQFAFIGDPEQPANDNNQATTAAQKPETETKSSPEPATTSDADVRLASLVVEGTYDTWGTNPDGSKYVGEAYLSRIGESWRFEWLIGGQTFVGIGEFNGDQLSIEWGDSNPVIYSVPKAGTLSGVWGRGGKGTDILVLRKPLHGSETEVQPVETNITGNYQVRGKNPDGSPYRGRLRVSKSGNRYQFNWRIGSQSFKGTGTRNGNLITVDWGSAQPIIYKVVGAGQLNGSWAGGRASEIARK